MSDLTARAKELIHSLKIGCESGGEYRVLPNEMEQIARTLGELISEVERLVAADKRRMEVEAYFGNENSIDAD